MNPEENNAYQLAIVRNPAQMAQEQQATEEKTRREEQEKNKMGWGVFIFSLLLSLIADLIEIFTAGTLGWFTGLLIDFVLFFTLGFTRAGQKQWKKLIGALFAESIYVVNILPIRTIMLTWSFIASRPKLMSKIDKTLKIASKIPSPIAAELKLASKTVSVATNVEQGNLKGALTSAVALKGTISKPPVIPPPKISEYNQPVSAPPKIALHIEGRETS